MIKKICKRCGYEWTPRIQEIRRCPRCKSYLWEKSDEKCEICRRTFFKLHTHHINGNQKDDKRKNKIYICEDCHTRKHSQEITRKPNQHHSLP